MLISETGSPGWAEVAIPDLTARVLIQIEEKGGRWVVATLIVNDKEVESATLKAISLSRVESMLNQHGIGAAIAGQPSELGGFSRSWREEFAKITEVLQDYTGSTPRPSFPPDAPPSPREPLERPDGSDPDAFYRKVAETYAALVVDTSSPAKVMAEEAEVPVPTVHRWIFEARRRGHLPPARKGRAG